MIGSLCSFELWFLSSLSACVYALSICRGGRPSYRLLRSICGVTLEASSAVSWERPDMWWGEWRLGGGSWRGTHPSQFTNRVTRIGSNCYVHPDVGCGHRSIIAHAQPIHFCHIIPNQAEAKGFGSITRMDRITSIIEFYYAPFASFQQIKKAAAAYDRRTLAYDRRSTSIRLQQNWVYLQIIVSLKFTKFNNRHKHSTYIYWY